MKKGKVGTKAHGDRTSNEDEDDKGVAHRKQGGDEGVHDAIQ